MTYSHFVVPYQTVWNACILLITQKVKSSMLYERRQTQHESFFRMLVSICKISSNFSRVCIFTFLLWIKKRWEWKMFMQFVFLGVICKLFIFLQNSCFNPPDRDCTPTNVLLLSQEKDNECVLHSYPHWLKIHQNQYFCFVSRKINLARPIHHGHVC